MQNNKINVIICDEPSNILNYVKKETVGLSIILPPYVNLKNYSYGSKKIKQKMTKEEKYIKSMRDLLKDLSAVTKPGGICCLILTDDVIGPEMIPVTGYLLDCAIDFKSRTSEWKYKEKITWVKSPEPTIQSDSQDEGIMINYHDTPFSEIYILEKNSKNEYVPLYERVLRLNISDTKKNEMVENLWFIQPTSEKGFNDTLPKELVLRLIMTFSTPGNVIVDPFAGDGIVAMSSKVLNRKFICFEKDSQKASIATKRLKAI